MPPAVIEKPSTLPPLTKVEQEEMDEHVRTRESVKSVSRDTYTKDRPRHERWLSRRKGFRLHIRKARRVQSDVVGESEIRQGLSIKFGGGELILDRQDPDYPLITKKLHAHHYYTLNHLVCVDELDEAQKKKTTHDTIGVSKRHQLKKIGIMNQKQQDDIMKVLDVKTQKDYDALEKKLKDLKEKNEKLEAAAKN